MFNFFKIIIIDYLERFLIAMQFSNDVYLYSNRDIQMSHYLYLYLNDFTDFCHWKHDFVFSCIKKINIVEICICIVILLWFDFHKCFHHLLVNYKFCQSIYGGREINILFIYFNHKISRTMKWIRHWLN